jgi:predicted small lipoprotein YifL
MAGPSMREFLRVASLACLFAASAGCGQTGKLYLPESSGEVVTRPAQPPPPATDTPANSPQTVDSPSQPDTPTEREKKKDKKN